jgi:hypothetical protein
MSQCSAALNIKGEAFQCDQPQGHGMAHGSTEAGAIWSSDTDQPIVGMSRAMDESRVQITEVSREELQQRMDAILAEYPWFANHPVTDCIDTDYEIAQKHGEDAAEAWRKYEGVVWLLTGSKPTGQSAAGESVTSQGTTNGFPIVGKCKHCGVHLTRSRDNDLVHASTYSRDCRITRQAELEDESQAAQPCPQCGGTMLPGKDYGCICHPTDYRAHREERMDHLEECYRSSFSTPEPECYCTRCHNTLIHHLDPAYYNDAKPSDWMTASNLESRIALLEEKVKALEDGYTGWKRGI